MLGASSCYKVKLNYVGTVWGICLNVIYAIKSFVSGEIYHCYYGILGYHINRLSSVTRCVNISYVVCHK
jgi:hypothetical protein